MFQLKKEHRPLLQELLPSLATIAEDHSSIEIKDIANDLRIAIATHGAVWSHDQKAATGNLEKQTDGEGVASGSICKETTDTG